MQEQHPDVFHDLLLWVRHTKPSVLQEGGGHLEQLFKEAGDLNRMVAAQDLPVEIAKPLPAMRGKQLKSISKAAAFILAVQHRSLEGLDAVRIVEKLAVGTFDLAASAFVSESKVGIQEASLLALALPQSGRAGSLDPSSMLVGLLQACPSERIDQQRKALNSILSEWIQSHLEPAMDVHDVHGIGETISCLAAVGITPSRASVRKKIRYLAPQGERRDKEVSGLFEQCLPLGFSAGWRRMEDTTPTCFTPVGLASFVASRRFDYWPSSTPSTEKVLHALSSLHQAGFDMGDANPSNGYNALCIAAARESRQIAEHLINAGVSPYTGPRPSGWLPGPVNDPDREQREHDFDSFLYACAAKAAIGKITSTTQAPRPL